MYHSIPLVNQFISYNRYIFRAFPQGTHWYHSHMRYQRDSGLFGVLIVHESKGDIHEKLGKFIDEPQKKTLTLLERFENIESDKGTLDPFCLPDGSNLPIPYKNVSFYLNGRLAAEEVEETKTFKRHLEFYVTPDKHYRFRVLGATKSTILMISIDFHKMYVIATDGFLVNEFETDYLVVHVGERYDFLLKAKADVKPGTKYPINIQTLAVKCDNYSALAGESYAFLVYTHKDGSKNSSTTTMQQNNRCFNASSPCKVLNCPFRIMPNEYGNDGPEMICYDVTSLQLLYPTLRKNLPSIHENTSSFFNFETNQKHTKAFINGVQFNLPDLPLVEYPDSRYECKYPVKCETQGEKYCPHVVYLDNFNTTARFVFTSIITKGEQGAPIYTHPIHMHGHTYFVAKIGYPEYYPNGSIKAPNKDVHLPSCGAGKWRDGPPEDIIVNSTTVRKDVVIVPAGGYVVIHFITNNPGYWFMHCHIDEHLNKGMAIAIGEKPSYASKGPKPLYHETNEFCFTVDTFIKNEAEVAVFGNRSVGNPQININSFVLYFALFKIAIFLL